MENTSRAIILIVLLLTQTVAAVTYSSRLIHRFSDELKGLRVSKKDENWPMKRSLNYYKMLVDSDVQRQNMKLGPHSPFLFPSEGSQTMSFGNDFGWLHYTWIDIGMPSVSFLVALDTGSDLLWVPCDCLQCAPLSASYYSILDRDLNEYTPSGSSTSKYLYCSHQLCELGPNCKSRNQSCPYTINYYTENVSSSGLLVEDILHLVSRKADGSNNYVRSPVIIGCGKKQSGGYLNGIAPDGLMGLGLKDISVPSFLAKSGVVKNSFSLCFNEDDSGRIYFGDQGISTQQTTPFLSLDGRNITYIIEVESCCISSSCPELTRFKALVDSGTSFTYLPNVVFGRVVKEFDRQFKGAKTSFDGYSWQYCYKASSVEMSKVPSMKLRFALNNSFVVQNLIFKIYNNQGLVGFCLAIQPTAEDMGTIGQNFMTGYRMVFDRENHKLGWSSSSCQEINNGNEMPLSPSPNGSFPDSLPTEQQSRPGGLAVAPAVAGRTPSKSSVTKVRPLARLLYAADLVPFLSFLLLARTS